MDATPLLYTTGEEIHIGDRVQYCANYATVVFITDGENSEYANGYEDYIGSERGVMVCDDDGTLNSLGEPNEQLVFMGRE